MEMWGCWDGEGDRGVGVGVGGRFWVWLGW